MFEPSAVPLPNAALPKILNIAARVCLPLLREISPQTRISSWLRERNFASDPSSKVELMTIDPFRLGRNIAERVKVPNVAQGDLRKVRKCADKMDEVREARDEAIREAWLAGETYRDIAEAARLSHQRVAQIVQAGRPKK